MIHSAGSVVFGIIIRCGATAQNSNRNWNRNITVTNFHFIFIRFNSIYSGLGFTSTWRRKAKAKMSGGRGTVERCFCLGEIFLRNVRYITALISYTYANFNDLLPQLVLELYDIAIWGFLCLLADGEEVFPFRISLFLHFPSGCMGMGWVG